MRRNFENRLSFLVVVALALSAGGQETVQEAEPVEAPVEASVEVYDAGLGVAVTPAATKEAESGAASPAMKEEDRQAAIEFLDGFQKAWLDMDVAALYRYLPATGRTPEPADRLEFLMNMCFLHGQGMSGVLDSATLEVMAEDRAAFKGSLISETGQSMAEIALVLQRKPEGWRIAEIGIGLDTGDLPDVFDPNGAFIPVNESQF